MAFVAVAIEAFNGVKRIRHRSVDILPASNQLHEDFPSGFFSRVSVFLGHRTIQDTNLNGASHKTKPVTINYGNIPSLYPSLIQPPDLEEAKAS